MLHLAERAGASAPVSEEARVGFAVGRAVGNAVTRNRVRRRLRHLVRERLDRMPVTGDLVVRALPASAHASYGALGRDLDAALGRLEQSRASAR